MAAIVINEKFKTLIPPLNKAEYAELEKKYYKKLVLFYKQNSSEREENKKDGSFFG